MKIGLKLWSTNVENYLKEAKRLFADRIYDYLELYVVPGSLDTLSAWQRLHDDIDLPFVIHAAHSRHEVNLANPEKELSNGSAFSDARQFADMLYAKTIIAHGGWVPDTFNGDGVVEVVRQLLMIDDGRLVIENKPLLPNDGLPRRLVGSTPHEIKSIMRNAGCGFCLDVGHAISSANAHGSDWWEMLIDFFALRPTIFHLSGIDISSKIDQHRHLGDGNIPLRRVLSLMPSSAMISIETIKDSRFDLVDFVADVAVLHRAMDI